MADFIKIAEEAFATGKQHPAFKAGDTITVAYKIVEGNKERIQLYRGVVIKISGHGDKRRFTVRKMSGTVGVERIFPIDSPNIDSIQINKVGKVRRAKLYYLRNLTGKKARIAEKRMNVKEDWSVVRYVGHEYDDKPRVFGLTRGRCYYWPCSKERPVYEGVIDDEEFTSYLYPCDAECWEIVLDPTGMAARALAGDADTLHAWYPEMNLEEHFNKS